MECNAPLYHVIIKNILYSQAQNLYSCAIPEMLPHALEITTDLSAIAPSTSTGSFQLLNSPEG